MEKVKSPYSDYFKLRNKDPSNYVLFKDFYLYSIIAIYVFYFWFLSSTLLHYDNLKRNDHGMAIIILSIIVLIGTFIVLSLGFINNKRFPYELTGIVFLLFLINLSLVLYYYDKRDLDADYSQDPVSIGITFLILYAFVSYFTC
jgi:fatty acid desaturase